MQAMSWLQKMLTQRQICAFLKTCINSQRTIFLGITNLQGLNKNLNVKEQPKTGISVVLQKIYSIENIIITSFQFVIETVSIAFPFYIRTYTKHTLAAASAADQQPPVKRINVRLCQACMQIATCTRKPQAKLCVRTQQ